MLSRTLALWGQPGRLRVDNGPPWGGANDLPPDVALWVLGGGIGLHWNRPRRCRENGKVERRHGVLAGWVEPTTWASASALPTRLAAASRLPREVSPAIQGQSRRAASPSLLAGGRRPVAAWAPQLVWTALAGRRWRRRVDKVGRISLCNRPLRGGRKDAGADVTVRLDAENVAWVIEDDRGRLLVRHAAPELSRERIEALAVSHRRPPRPHPRRRGNARVLAPGGKPDTR